MLSSPSQNGDTTDPMRPARPSQGRTRSRTRIPREGFAEFDLGLPHFCISPSWPRTSSSWDITSSGETRLSRLATCCRSSHAISTLTGCPVRGRYDDGGFVAAGGQDSRHSAARATSWPVLAKKRHKTSALLISAPDSQTTTLSVGTTPGERSWSFVLERLNMT